MNDTYRPPQAVVADPAAARRAPRPRSIAIALLLIGAAVVEAGVYLVRGDIFDIAGRVI